MLLPQDMLAPEVLTKSGLQYRLQLKSVDMRQFNRWQAVKSSSINQTLIQTSLRSI